MYTKRDVETDLKGGESFVVNNLIPGGIEVLLK